jgi:hypothetical protein
VGRYNQQAALGGRIRRLLSALAIASLTASCSAMSPVPQFATANGADVHFSGIADLLNDTRPVDVILVHGMCTHHEKWARDSFEALSLMMGDRATSL